MNKRFLRSKVDEGGVQGKHPGEKEKNVQKHETWVKIL